MLTTELVTKYDLEIIRDLAGQIFPQTYASIISPDQIEYMMNSMYSLESLNNEIEIEKQIFHLVKHNNTPCGYFSLQVKAQDVCILQKLYILPSLQGKGIGKQVVNKAILYIKNNMPNIQKLQLYVNRENKAKGFYINYGFKIIDKRDIHIGKNFYMNDFVMQYNL